MLIPSNIIINADDFGANSKINSAISKCFAIGIINSTTMLTNGDGVPEAIKLCNEKGFCDKIGLHANLTEGKPLTDLSGTKLVNREGYFIKENAQKKFIYLPFNVKTMVKAEIEAQLNILYYNKITPTHIDSHHHIHTLPWLAPIFLAVAKNNNIKIRIAQTWNRNSNILVPLYRNVLNKVYKRNKLNFTDYFETVESYTNSKSMSKRKNKLTEIMVHPDFNINNNIYDSTDATYLETTLIDLMIPEKSL